MHVTCPRCHRSLSTTEPSGPPVFCMYCGQKLRDTDPDLLIPPTVEMRTTSFVPFGPDPDDLPTIETPPEAIGGYTLLKLLGSGGMGSVYEAEVPGGRHRVAVKLLSSRLASSPTSVERFKQEGRLASQLSHPRCVFVLAADTEAGRPYIVMELMPGRTLREVVDEGGPLGSVKAITYILDVIDGLAEAHRLGVLHRDIKPSNCFLTTDDRVKVGDFGLSKSLAGPRDQHLTTSGAFLGTVLFASPEQLRGEPLDYASDVYSVCATLYYLLCGEAPYQHESVMAALARVITEPPPPIRLKVPDVPVALERVVMRGLERDRSRRWASLDDLRDALAGMLPSRQPPARPRLMMAAYVLDRILLTFLTVPAELLRRALVGEPDMHLELFELRWAAVLTLLLYFTIGEGLFGATPAKWLLNLRVSRIGRTEPPGLWAAFLRSATFTAMILLVLGAPELLSSLLPGASGGLLGLGVFILGLAALAIQLRRSEFGYRGLHDRLSGCHVTQRPLPARKLRLLPLKPHSPDAEFLASSEKLPQTVSGFAIRGCIQASDSGEQVWAAEDKALERKVLLWLRPTSAETHVAQITEVTRPSRLRRLGSGSIYWNSADYEWVAFSAPVGSPLVETISPDRPLPWADARFLIEQLVEEFLVAECEGSVPLQLSLRQVWVEPNGRLILADISAQREEDAKPGNTVSDTEEDEQRSLCLVRQVATLTLEGTPRVSGARVRAPVPPHAAPILEKLFAPTGYRSLSELHADLNETHAHTPEVTASVRTAQLGIQAGVLAFGLFLMFFVAAIPAVLLAKVAEHRAEAAEQTLLALSDPAVRSEWERDPEFEAALRNLPQTRQRIERLHRRKQHEAEERRRELLSFQRFALLNFEEGIEGEENAQRDAELERDVLLWAAADPRSVLGRKQSPWEFESMLLWIPVLIVPLIWIMVSAVMRGGVSMALTGVTLVRADGRSATRRRCALRTALVWAPITLLLTLSLWLQVEHPAWALAYVSLWLIAAVLVPVYIAVALWRPDRPPHDRILGTYLVPI